MESNPQQVPPIVWTRALDAASMNAAASAKGSPLNVFPTPLGQLPVAPAYFDFTPAPYPRPFDALSSQRQSDPVCSAQFAAAGAEAALSDAEWQLQ